MKRLLLVVTAVVALVSVPGTAFAQENAGCQAFGQLAAFEAQLEVGIGEEVSAAAPANDDVVLLKAVCG